MLAVRLPKDLEGLLERTAKKTHRSKSYYVVKSLRQYLEDREDYLAAVEAMKDKSPRIPYEKIREKLGLDN